MILERTTQQTLTPFELDIGDKLMFTKVNGESVEIELISTSAQVRELMLKNMNIPIFFSVCWIRAGTIFLTPGFSFGKCLKMQNL